LPTRVAKEEQRAPTKTPHRSESVGRTQKTRFFFRNRVDNTVRAGFEIHSCSLSSFFYDTIKGVAAPKAVLRTCEAGSEIMGAVVSGARPNDWRSVGRISSRQHNLGHYSHLYPGSVTPAEDSERQAAINDRGYKSTGRWHSWQSQTTRPRSTIAVTRALIDDSAESMRMHHATA
jgi:hypothetical protein